MTAISNLVMKTTDETFEEALSLFEAGAHQSIPNPQYGHSIEYIKKVCKALGINLITAENLITLAATEDLRIKNNLETNIPMLPAIVLEAEHVSFAHPCGTKFSRFKNYTWKHISEILVNIDKPDFA